MTLSNKPSRTDDPDQIEASLGSQPGPLAWKVSNLERQERKRADEERLFEYCCQIGF